MGQRAGCAPGVIGWTRTEATTATSPSFAAAPVVLTLTRDEANTLHKLIDAGIKGGGGTCAPPAADARDRALAFCKGRQPAKASGAVKPSGAGGGDILVAFSHDPALLDALVRCGEALGMTRVPLDVDPLGVRAVEGAGSA